MPIDFCIAGMPKAGTTLLWACLRQHPQIFLPDIKEPGYFAFPGRHTRPSQGPLDPNYWRNIVSDWPTYRALYARANGKMRGDASPIYALAHHAPSAIAAAAPEARIVLCLREPGARAFSQYAHHRRDGIEPATTLADALRHERMGRREDWSHFHRYGAAGHYRAVIERFDKHFPRSQIYIGFYENLSADPRSELRKICQFLDVRDDFPFDSDQRLNVSRGTHAARLEFVRRLLNHGSVPTRLAGRLMSHGLRARLKVRMERWNTGNPIQPDEEGLALVRNSAKNDLAWLQDRAGDIPADWTRV